ncbi:hypothetical protein C8Q78DRAFT_942322, partial [Trametes maxima]
LVVAAAIAGANAQGSSSAPAAPTSTAGISACIIGCITQSATANGCSGLADINCFCTSPAFQAATLSCLQSTCTSAEVQAAEALQQSECAAGTPPSPRAS